MAQSVNVNFKLDADVKKSMEQACADMGLSLSAAFTVFAKKVAREKRIIVQDIKNGKAHFAEHDLIEVD